MPSRLWPASFYALPQSPQQLKQLLMVAGQDRYYQIVRCLRDEAPRADRGFEFTQLDVEMSFVDEEDVIAVIEPLYARLSREIAGRRGARRRSRRMTYDEMVDRYGSDKADLRYGMELVDLVEVFAGSGFNAFAKVSADGGSIKALAAPGGGGLSPQGARPARRRREGPRCGRPGLAGRRGRGTVRSPVEKFLTPDEIERILQRTGAGRGRPRRASWRIARTG